MLGGESEEKGSEYREPSILLPPPGKSCGEMLGMSWQLLCVLVILGIHGEVDTQLFAPFFLSRVVSARSHRCLSVCSRRLMWTLHAGLLRRRWRTSAAQL